MQGRPAEAKSYDETKIDASFAQQILADPKADYDIVVRAADADLKDPSKAKARAEKAGKKVKELGGKHKFGLAIVSGAAGRLSGQKILDLTKDKEIDYVSKDVPFKATFDPKLDGALVHQAGIDLVQAKNVWSSLGITGKGVGVAVVDSGVFGHPDLAGRIVAAVDLTTATPTTSNVPLTDLGGHGTHVAGLIAGDGSASAGLYAGVAPQANIIDVRVIDSNGNSNTSIILRGLQWVMANRAAYNIKVVNMSLGATPSGSYKTDPMATAAEVLAFSGITVVVSAGNSGSAASTITSPATDPYVITVGALDDNGTLAGLDDSIAAFSSRGRTAFDRLAKPDVVAPGRKMISLLAPSSTIPTMYPERLVTADGALTAQYLRMSGTSMAAPMVSGIAALLYQRNPSITPPIVKSTLKKTATSLSFGTDADRGAGLVNAYKAVTSISTTKEYPDGRVSDAFAKDMRKFIQGQPIVWRDPTYHGGVDAKGITWDGITWDNISWDGITWDNISWDGFTWEGISWEGVTWESVTWESSGALSGTGGGFAGMVD